jgi:NADH-quinone oxidoreductase subunit J
MEQIAFFVLSLLAVSSALVVITHRNEIICALALAFNLVSIAGFYFLLGAQFIGFLQIIVYAGAIMVLILFVVMLLNVGREDYAPAKTRVQRWAAPVLTVVFALVLMGALRKTELHGFEAEAAGFGTVAALGKELFGKLYFPFEVISLLLVAAMIGSVMLAKRRL